MHGVVRNKRPKLSWMAKKRNSPKQAKTAEMTHIGLNTSKFRTTSQFFAPLFVKFVYLKGTPVLSTFLKELLFEAIRKWLQVDMPLLGKEYR